MKTMLKKCHHFTLTDSFVIVKKINFYCQVHSLRKRDNGRGKHFEYKIRFLIINQVHPTLFLRNLSFIKFKGDLATETNEDNGFITAIHIVIILCFIEHLCYLQEPAEILVMFSF